MQRKTTPVPVRMDADMRQRLARAAKKMGSNASSVIRFAVLQQLPKIEGGTITISR